MIIRKLDASGDAEIKFDETNPESVKEAQETLNRISDHVLFDIKDGSAVHVKAAQDLKTEGLLIPVMVAG